MHINIKFFDIIYIFQCSFNFYYLPSLKHKTIDFKHVIHTQTIKTYQSGMTFKIVSLTSVIAGNFIEAASLGIPSINTDN